MKLTIPRQLGYNITFFTYTLNAKTARLYEMQQMIMLQLK